MESIDIKNQIVKILQEKKADDLIVIDVAEQTIVTEYFVIASGTNNTQVKALAEHLDEQGEEKGLTLYRKDGMQEARWVVLDYGSVIVHIFNKETRGFYCLEKLWSKDTNVTRYQ